jgi:glycosyltransferase involved in cell wall biosynthesis
MTGFKARLQRVLGPITLPNACSIGDLPPANPTVLRAVRDYRLRWRRRYLLARAFRRRRQVRVVQDRTASIAPGAILAFVTLRNEALRLPHFLQHYRRLGVDHFIVVDNASDDGSLALLRGQPDVSLWVTDAGYKQSRFGLDWLTWLQRKHGSGHWCLTLDADEVLVYPYHETRNLRALTEQLQAEGRQAFGAMMLDMYPKGPLAAQDYTPGQDPTEVLPWFDAGNYMVQVQPRLGNLWIQGGPRARHFFADQPRLAPTLNKVPLVFWRRGYVYVNSTHAILPRRLNGVFDTTGGERISGILLHTKFLPQIVEKSAEERQRQQHFANSSLYDAYYANLTQSPDLWCAASRRYTGWRQLEAMGLMSRGGWI